MSVQTKSKILLSALVLGGMAPSLYLLFIGYAPWGVGLILLGVAILLWMWQPWRWLKKSP
jgi:ABC-type transport system involved in cytochrome bd biosynthesis fused ATPase/permease subunit